MQRPVTMDSIKQIDLLIQANILENVRNKTSLATIPLSSIFWKPSIHVAEGLWSTCLTRFRCQNAGLGNRSDSHRNFSSHDSRGRVVKCPLCSFYRNGEVHLLVKCICMEPSPQSITTVEGKSLREILNEITVPTPIEFSNPSYKIFPGSTDGFEKVRLCVKRETFDPPCRGFLLPMGQGESNASATTD